MGRNMNIGCFPKILGIASFYCAMSTTRNLTMDTFDQFPIGLSLLYGTASLILGLAARHLANQRKRRRQIEENRIALDPHLPFALLLRPFSSDNTHFVDNPHGSNTMKSAYENRQIDLVELLADALRPKIQLRAIGGSPTGPGTINTSEENWRQEFTALTSAAIGVMVILMPGKDIVWELEQLRARRFLEKTVFVIPRRAVSNPSEEDLAFAQVLKEKKFDVPLPASSLLIFSLDKMGHLEDIVKIQAVNYKSIRPFLVPRWGHKHLPEIPTIFG